MNQPVLCRQQIYEQLHEAFHHPLTLVTAAMGYGKSTAVRHFLDQQQARYAWLYVENDDASAQNIWHSLTRQIVKMEPELGSRLNTLGFPADSAQRDRMLDYIEDQLFGTNTILVLDDYHHVLSAVMDELVERIVRKAIPGLHLILISRVRPRFSVEELTLKGLCFQLKNSLFELSPEETQAFFSMFGHNLSADMTMHVQAVTEGWITAVYLMMKNYAETGTFDQETDINSLLEKAIMAQYTREETRMLTLLAPLESFTHRQAVHVSGRKDAAAMVRKLCLDNSLIHYNSQTGKYKMHNILAGFLQEKLDEAFDDDQQSGLYRRAGEWEIKNHNLLAGLHYFLKAREFDLILEEFEKPGITRVIDTAPEEVVAIFEQIPWEVRYRHPVGYITYVDFFVTDVDMVEGTRLLNELEDHYQNDSDLSPELIRKIMGEITLVRSFSCFNDMREMTALHMKAHELLKGRSAIANREMIFTFGSPHAQYLFYREKGDLWGITEFSDRAIKCYNELSDGCGAGFEHLSRAEYFLETGQLDQVEAHARKAIHKAKSMDQLSIILCARFTLARLLAARGQFLQARNELHDLSDAVGVYHNPILHNTLELCSGYLGGITGNATDFAAWLKEGDMKQSDILYQGMAFNYLVHAKYVLLEGDYLKLEVLCEELRHLFSLFNNLLGFVHTYVIEAIAKEKLYGPDAARPSLLQALEIGKADGLVLPFAEYGGQIIGLLRSLQQENDHDAYLNRLMDGAEAYRLNLVRAGAFYKQAVSLTDREKEILLLVVAGMTNKEVAGQLYLAEVTVKKAVTAVYRKLGVSGRAAAVRKALELGFIPD
ncbi:MAG: LuxR C-terminal-related transcriptional regulator [Bacillota bacterium]|nr:LuxR C-terminal-related transcriptional regulator [Bacillota bacterium]MDW7678661.1 LuxR C-terminal-related transcriptional regulator [Bacillota bacterium]